MHVSKGLGIMYAILQINDKTAREHMCLEQSHLVKKKCSDSTQKIAELAFSTA